MGTSRTRYNLWRTGMFGLTIACLALPACFAQLPDDAGQVQRADHKAAAKLPQYPKVLAEGTSSNAIRKAAISEIPLSDVEESKRPQVEEILKGISFFRRLPTLEFSVHPDVYEFFTTHPDAAVSLWRVMKISKVQMWQTSKTEYEADVGDGSTGEIEFLVKSPTRALVYCDGMYKSPILRRSIKVKSLVMLRTNFTRATDGTTSVQHRADIFVSFPSATVDVVAKIFSPLTVSLCDSTFSEISLFLKMMSTAMVRRPDWIEDMAGKMDGVIDRRRDELLRLTSQVYTEGLKQKSASATETPDESTAQTSQPPSAVRPVREVRK